jgi:hypothetical protein
VTVLREINLGLLPQTSLQTPVGEIQNPLSKNI